MAHIAAYQKYVEKLVRCLPMDDARFIASLSAKQLLPGDNGSKIDGLNTPSDKASYFLSHVIKPALDIDITSDFDQLLLIMQNCGYRHVQQLAGTIKDEVDKLQPKSQPVEAKKQPDEPKQSDQNKSDTPAADDEPPSLDSKPKFLQLKNKFNEVADWESICPYLINDDTGQRTKTIKRNGKDVEEMRDEMLRAFLKETNPTWRKVIEALRAGRYNNLADSIEKELQG